jgi:hypothetical protein
MTQKFEHDWPPTMRYHRRPRVEVMEPEEPPTRRYHRVEITVRHHRRRQPPRFLPVFLAIVAVLLLCRYPFGFLMLAALAGWQMIGTALFVVAVLGVLAWRDHRAGRPF